MALDQLLHPTLDPDAPRDVLGKRAAGQPGRGARARSCSMPIPPKAGPGAARRSILVRVETSPEDIHGMHAAKGILTARGGMTSHAAVVARGMGRPCVSGRIGRLDRHQGAHAQDRRPRVQGRRRHHPRRRDRRDHGRRGPDHRARAGRRFRHADGMGRQAPPHEGAHQCRDPGRLPHGAPVRRRGHRPVPHRAHVLRRRRGSARCAR